MIVWGVKLEDQVSPAANSAADAMQDLGKQALVLERALASAQGAMTRAAAVGNIAAFKQASSNAQMLKVSLGQVEEQLGPFAKAWAELKSQVGARWRIEFDPLEWASKGVEALRGMGEAVIDVARDIADLVGEAPKAIFDALAGSAEGGKAAFENIRELSKILPQSERDLQGWAKSLMGAGVGADRLQGSILAISASATLLGEGAAAKTQGLLSELAEQSEKGTKTKFSMGSLAGTGVGEAEFLRALGMTPENFNAAKKAGTITGEQISDAILTALQNKGAGPIAAQMNTLGALTTKAKDSLVRLVEEVDISPLTDALKDFMGILDDTSPSGQATGMALKEAFHEVMVVMGAMVEGAKVGFELLIIAGLEAAIFIKQNWGVLEPIFIGIATAISGALLGAMAALTVAAWGIVAPAIIAAAPFLLWGAAITAVSVAIVELISHAGQIANFLGAMIQGGAQAASDFVDGMVNGLISGVGKIAEAAKGAAGAALSAVKHALGIASPSQVMFEMGVMTAHGFAGGIAANENHVEVAASGLGVSAVGGASKGASGGGGGSGRASVSVTIGEVHIGVGHGADLSPAGASALRQMVAEELSTLAEKIALEIGAAPVGSEAA